MKKISYKLNGNNVHEVLLTNKEMADAIVAWKSDKNYFCPRLNNFYSKFISCTGDRKYEKRFKHLVGQVPNGKVTQYIFDHQAKSWYEFDEFTDYEKVVDNVITRERGGDAPLRYLPKFFSEDENDMLLKSLIAIDAFLDSGGELGY